MFKRNRIKVLLAAVLFVNVFYGCTKKWDEHNTITDNAINNNLVQAISGTSNLTKFSDLLVKSGYDKIISSSKTYTVWAPNDQALQTLDPAIVNDSIKLKQFVGNHISNQSYLAGGAGSQRIKMLNGKYIIISSANFDSANIVTPNAYANNGILHIIDKYIPRLDNTWEFIKNTAVAPKMKSFLLSLNHNVFDPTGATQTGVNPLSGLPVYDTASGTVVRNTFLDSVMNVSDETNQYTLILLTDNSYTTEYNKISPWFKTSTADSTTMLSGLWLVKDLAFNGVYTAAQLPDTIVSQYGVKVPINKSSITASYRTSNGIVHVMSQVNFNLTYKFPPIIIQGENPIGFAALRPANTFYRVRSNPNTGQVYNDLLVQNYNFTNYYVGYFVRNMPSMRYNAFWVAVNDVQTTPLWTQRLAVDSTTNTANLPAVTVAYRNFNEVPLGQITIANYRNLYLYVMNPAAASTSNATNLISLDYIKLVPAF
jgi:uncharacterized surface protein with fasciclin (FAS1) repeats